MDKQERESMEKQKATKYSDEEIKKWIDNSTNWNWDCAYECHPAIAQAHAQIAQAMIAYNNMIDARWGQ